MKQISVSEKCSGCGLCIVGCEYLQENRDGNAEPVEGKAIREEDFAAVEKVVSQCPEGALQIVETGSTKKRGTEGVKDIIEELRKKCDSFSVKKISNADVRLNSKDYNIPVPYSNKEYEKAYKSESAAKSAARDEFNRLCYSETAYRPMLKKVFVEYKVNVLKPYYTCTDTEDSIYYSYNKEIRKILSNAYAEICDIMGDDGNVPESWKEFSVYFSENDIAISPIKNFDNRSTNSGIIADLRSEGEYTSINWYVDRMDFDYDEIYAGEGMFGKMKFKNMWGFSGFYSAASEFVDDLKSSINSMSGEIEDGAVDAVNSALTSFEDKVKNVFSGKISELEKYIG